ncbi:VOC family protein [soil metagenome]
MALRLVQVNFKATDDAALGQFWADALGWSISSEGPGVTNLEPPGFDWPDPAAVCIDVVTVPDPETVVYRAHLELASSSDEHRAELVRRLTRLGATSVAGSEADMLADPEGNVFRVLEPREIYRDTGPIAAVVVECVSPRVLAQFWGEATDWTLLELNDEHARLRSSAGVGPYLEFIHTAGRASVRSRVHLDLKPYARDDQEAEVVRLRELGATEIDIGQGDVSWRVLTDPEGNEFCVLAAG